MKNRIALLSAFILLASAVFAQSGAILLSATQVAQKLKEVSSTVILDVRTPAEFAKGHLPNAVNMDWLGNDFEKNIASLDKAVPVVIYCEDGNRSAEAAVKLRSLGFTQVAQLEGGFYKWKVARLPIETPVPTKLKGVTRDQFAALLQTDKTVLVDVYADWCGPCRLMKPHIEKVEKEMGDKLQVLRINSDDNPELVSGLNIEALPTLLVYENGKLKQVSVGYINKAAIQKLVK